MTDDSATGGTPRGADESDSRPRAQKKVTCEFCECVLTPSGDLFGQLSEKAKKFRDVKQELENVREQLTTAKEQVVELETKLREARGQSSPSDTPDSPVPVTRRGVYI